MDEVRTAEWRFDLLGNGTLVSFFPRVSLTLERALQERLRYLRVGMAKGRLLLVKPPGMDDGDNAGVTHVFDLEQSSMRVLENNSVTPIFRVTLPAGGPPPPPVWVSWEWDASGMLPAHWGVTPFLTYDLLTTSIIEQAFLDDPLQPPFEVDMGGKKYDIDLQELVQRNKATGFERKIRRIVDNYSTRTKTAVAQLGAAAAGASSTMERVARNMRLYQTMTQWVVIPRRDLAKDESCSICTELFSDTTAAVNQGTEVVRLSRCTGHFFHAECAVNMLQNSPRCANCGTFYKVPVGDCPNGTMSHSIDLTTNIPGHPQTGSIVIVYRIPPGIQDLHHVSPGVPFSGTLRVAYLPNSPEGHHMLALLSRAFGRRLTFTIGQSLTTGMSNTIVWTTIHHKTVISGTPYGYPDVGYFGRLETELRGFGIF